MAETIKSSRMPYLPVRTSSLNEKRKVTDVGFLILFFLILLAWISICCIDMYSEERKSFSSNKNHEASISHSTNSKTTTVLFGGDAFKDRGHEHSSNNHRELSTSPFIYDRNFKVSLDGTTLYTFAVIRQRGIPIVLFCTLGGLITALVFILLVRLIPQFWVFIAIVWVMLGIVALTYIDINVFPSNWSFFTEKQIWDICRINFYGVICVLTMISVVNVKTNIIAKYARKTCQAFFHFPSAFLFGLFLLSLDLFVAIITRMTFSLDTTTITYLPMKLTSLYLRNFIYYFGIMVYAQFIGTYHTMKNVDAPPKTSIFLAFMTIAKYHAGTAAFAATIILPFFLGIYVLLKHTSHYAKTTLGSFIEIGWKILLLFAGISDVALVETSFKGVNLFNATKRVFNITSKKSTLVLAVSQILTYIMVLGMALSIIGAAAIPHFAFNISMENSLMISVGSIVLLHLPVLLLVGTSAVATILYHIEVDEYNESQLRPSHIPLNGVVTH